MSLDLKSLVRTIPDYPKPGILFRDITTLIEHPEGFKESVERLAAEPGEQVDFDQVLMVGEEGAVRVGTPYVEGGRVTAQVKAHGRADKVRILKMRRRKHYQKRQGHRQNYTELFIGGIASASGNSSVDVAQALERARNRTARYEAAVAGGEALKVRVNRSGDAAASEAKTEA